MYQEFYAKSGLLIWPLVGLVIFITIFLAVLGYVFIGLKNGNKIDKIAAMPLDNETESEFDAHAEGRAQNHE